MTWNFATYADALTTYWPQLVRSLIYAGVATLLTLALGYPLAWFIASRSGRYKNVLLVLVIAPFFTSFLIRTLAWQTILGDSGLLAQVALRPIRTSCSPGSRTCCARSVSSTTTSCSSRRSR